MNVVGELRGLAKVTVDGERQTNEICECLSSELIAWVFPTVDSYLDNTVEENNCLRILYKLKIVVCNLASLSYRVNDLPFFVEDGFVSTVSLI